jgi:hypothetical protein
LREENQAKRGLEIPLFKGFKTYAQRKDNRNCIKDEKDYQRSQYHEVVDGSTIVFACYIVIRWRGKNYYRDSYIGNACKSSNNPTAARRDF